MLRPNFTLNCCKILDFYGSVHAEEESDRIDKRIRKRNKKVLKPLVQKILLLGTGESGKSTFLKQMRIITGKSFTNFELETFKSVIYDNIYKGVLYLLQARSTLGIAWAASGGEPAVAAERLEEHFRRTRALHRERTLHCSGVPAWSEEEFLELAPLFYAIWADSSIRATFDQRNRFITEGFSENTRYYLNRLHQIAIPNYIPTKEDIVWSRRPTDSIIEEEIMVHGTPLIFVDVGGQTKERRKWCQTFTDMISILFLVGSSHYDELYLDRVTGECRNKLREAMTVFEGLINLDTFRRVSIIIFFNKTDLLKEKIEAHVSGIRAHFQEFPDDADEFNLVSVQNFLVESFASLVDPVVYPSGAELPPTSEMRHNRLCWFQRMGSKPQTEASGSNSSNAIPSRGSDFSNRVPRKRTIYRHFTTAVDTKNIQMVFNAMQDTILQNNLRRLMLS
ncbi:Guanine nucleotide-binding protein subunit alpha-12 [Echinococcus granulosus]|uniref:Guanine nucleotide binding protein subunit n=1 Tax=Echinococcus granulosus TaxID=6210 RepID=A0A068WNS4_ECHGR|nr:Guanine nucleotide-binding protein subunit alpha-12 [Echinococcus granulosus]CDS19311.1 guanine nucleotide binding protein subunit [Echinococcus granulosus]